jgi:site-specific DNA-methyltransferase (adenine-specific)
MWVYGSGFPKSLNIGKAIDKAAGAEREVIGSDTKARSTAGKSALPTIGGTTIYETWDITAPATADAKQWEGWGTALKPAHEPIVLARKPLDGTVANNVLTHGVGGINIDGCRVGEGTGESKTVQYPDIRGNNHNNASGTVEYTVTSQGRFPANFIHDGSDEVLQLFPSVKADESAARFFYCAKASKKDRNEGLDDMPLQRRAGLVGADRDGELDDVSERWRTQPAANHHPTVKPTDLMRYLCRLVTPPNGTVLDPFTGSGSTGKAATLEGFNFIGIEQSAEYAEIANARINHAKENK